MLRVGSRRSGVSPVCWHEHKGALVPSSRDTARAVRVGARVPGAGSCSMHREDGGGVVRGQSASSPR